MNTNPYESPRSSVVNPSPLDAERTVANRSVRIALAIMLLPAIYNFMCFNFQVEPGSIESPIRNVYRVVNGIGFAALVAAIWFCGLTALEFVTGGFHAIFGKGSHESDWKLSLYEIIRRAPMFAVGGAVLWACWATAFYQFGVNFHVITLPIGAAAHLLAAGLYLPLFYRWYKLERTAVESQIST